VNRFIVAVGLALSCGGPREPDGAKPAPALWIHRALVVGRARAEASLDELSLEVDGDRATLVATEKRASQAGFQVDPSALSFREIRRTTLGGTARVSNHALDLVFSGDSGKTMMHCTYERRRVASARAVRVRDPSFESECGNRGVWRPSDEVETDALVCAPTSAPIGADARSIVFGRAPGIELLGISEGCFIQGEAERLVPEDGSLAPALAR
jgi:hypothetical protein